MKTTVFQKYDKDEITDKMLREAAQLFSNHYGIWGNQAAKFVGPSASQGSRVKMSEKRLRAECLPSDAECSYVRATVDGCLAGHAFACRWKFNEKTVCWISQLVVHRQYRESGLAGSLLNELKQDDDDIYGIVSSHAAACLAAANAFGKGIKTVPLTIIHDHAEAMMKTSPICYIKDAKLHGRLFNSKITDGSISCVDNSFFVDHAEPLEALRRVREDNDWPLGELIAGHEYLLIVEARRSPTTLAGSSRNISGTARASA